MHPAQLDESELADQCQFSFLRRSGPGGQNRNKVETAVIALHTPTGITAEANEERSQDANRKQAVRRLRLKLAVEIRAGCDVSETTELWRSRVQGSAMLVSANHPDFPAILAESIDFLAACQWNHAIAAEKLGITSSQLVRLLGKHPPALAVLNDQRAKLGLRRLSNR
jgi:hypothetical protein